MKVYKVLYLSDTISFNSEIVYLVEKLGYETIHRHEIEEAYMVFDEKKPDIILVDQGFKNDDLLKYIEYIRTLNTSAPIITLYDISIDIEKFLNVFFIDTNLNKDQFIKRFKEIEKTILKIYEFNKGITYSVNDRSFYQNNKVIILNKQEANLIEFLLKEPEQYHRYITIQSILSTKKDVSIDSLRTLVKNIRKKTYSNIITNMSGLGYKINLKTETKGSDKETNILICDDQISNIEFLSTLLTKHIDDICIFKANGGKEALEILKKEDINILLLDIHMPGVSGWDVARYINKKLFDRNIATIFITSVYIDDEFQKEGFELGAVDYITKPVDQNLLINRLRLYIKSFNQEKKILKEIEKRRFQEKELLQKEVMVAQSTVLEKLAHHWRQPLSHIATNASLIGFLLDAQMDKEKIHEAVDSINMTTQNLSDLIEQFQSFFKPTSQKSMFNLKKMIRSVIMLMRFSFSQNNIKLKLDLDNIEFFGYENEFKQIVISLLTNSVDILLEKDVGNKYIEVSLKRYNGTISLSIIDNGGGVDKKIENRIYEPYFTTKHEYMGTGLSLHLAKEIVQRYLSGTLMNKNISYDFKGKEFKCAKFTVNLKDS